MTINLQNIRLTNVINCDETTTLYTHDSNTNKGYLKGILFHNLSTYAEVSIDFLGEQILYLALNEKDTVTFEFPYPLIFQADGEILSLSIPIGDTPSVNVILFGEKTTA